jgi:hypothetical protein
MRATEFISEAPLADFQPLGDFTKPGPVTGKWDTCQRHGLYVQ